MKRSLVTLLLLVIATSVSAQFLSSKPDNYAVNAENYIDFIPIAPVQIKSDVISATSNNEIKTQTTLQMSMDKQSVLNFLPNESMETTIQRFNADGSVGAFKVLTQQSVIFFNDTKLRYLIQNLVLL